MAGETKSSRLLAIYSALAQGSTLSKKELSQRFHITERSVQRDMESLRCFFEEEGVGQDICYDRTAKGYRLISTLPAAFTNSEILAVCKILLESRSMVKEEMIPLLDKLVDCCVPEANKRMVKDLLANEKFLYVEPHHGKPLLPGLWDLGQAVQQHKVLEIQYHKLKGQATVQRTIEPVGLLFSEYYFYLVAFIRNIDKQKEFENPDDLFPTIYRVDRILSFRETGEHFHPAYTGRFQEGEFRKRVQFMYGGKLEKIRFRYTGPSIEAVLDRLPTAEILSQDADGWTVEAEVFGKGIEMWMKGQGEMVQKV
jgi:predicted DNA-binding transcriptional regulator YafY